MYLLIYRHDGTQPHECTYTVMHASETLEECAEKRRVSGDLVISDTGQLVTWDTSWLFGWEDVDPNCYVQRMIRLAKEGKFHLGKCINQPHPLFYQLCKYGYNVMDMIDFYEYRNWR